MNELTEVAHGLQFPEGPIAMPDGSIVLVEIARGTLSRVSPAGDISVIAELGGGPNGAAMGPDGKCYICNNGGFIWHRSNDLIFPGEQPDDYTGGRIERVDLESGEVETLYTECNGTPLRGPNDIVFDKTGGFWFTDHGKMRLRDRDRTGVFYAQADGSSIEELIFPLESPNGIGLSPDENKLYVAETPTGRLWCFDLSGPGNLNNRINPNRGTMMAQLSTHHMFDSLALDSAGNVCVATLLTGGITIHSADGQSAEFLEMPDIVTTNICFGGEQLDTAFITLSSTGRLVSMPWPRPGLPLNFLNQ
jgi:gluconolactonase